MESHKAEALPVLFKHEGSEPPLFSGFRQEIENKIVAKHKAMNKAMFLS